MFTEILRIIPRLDEGRTKAAEASLSQRFGRIANRFGSGLKNAIKGSIVGLSLAFLTKLLNPLNDLHDRIKKLLGENEDVRDIAAKFGTTPGEFLVQQARAEALGVKPEAFIALLDSFKKVVDQRKQDVDEKTRKEVGKDPLLFQENNLAGFQRALNIIELFSQTDPAKARAFQRELFGETLTPNQLKLTPNGNDVPFLGNLHTQANRAQQATEQAAKGADTFRAFTAAQNFEDRIASNRAITGGVVQGLLESQQKELDKQFKELQNFEVLQKAGAVLDGVLGILETLKDTMFKILAFLSDELGPALKDFIKIMRTFLPSTKGRK